MCMHVRSRVVYAWHECLSVCLYVWCTRACVYVCVCTACELITTDIRPTTMRCVDADGGIRLCICIRTRMCKRADKHVYVSCVQCVCHHSPWKQQQACEQAPHHHAADGRRPRHLRACTSRT